MNDMKESRKERRKLAKERKRVKRDRGQKSKVEHNGKKKKVMEAREMNKGRSTV